jgi:hypothetical protein
MKMSFGGRVMVAGSVVLFGCSVLSATAQDAQVTFYSSGSFYGNFSPDSKHSAFVGYVFDGDKKIGFVQVKHFLTFRLPPGPHVFSASLSDKHPATNSQLALDLFTGTRYFVRVQEETKAAVLLGIGISGKGRLDAVDCQTAQEEAAKMKPSSAKGIATDWKDKIVITSALPGCN